MQLTPRLQTIYNHITGKTLADIGTDHAYLPIALAESDRIKTAIAADLNPGPLQIATENVKKHSLTDKISLRLGDGLAPIAPKEADIILIAGMGGELISKILAAHPETAKSAERLILQPMNAQPELRKWLFENSYTILKEDLATEGYKVYNILLVKPAPALPPEKEISYHLPESLKNHPDFPALWAKKHREFTKIYQGQLASKEPDQEILNRYKALLQDAERIKP